MAICVIKLVDGQHYLPCWHMNKRHWWYTIILDGSVPMDEICHRGESYQIAIK